MELISLRVSVYSPLLTALGLSFPQTSRKTSTHLSLTEVIDQFYSDRIVYTCPPIDWLCGAAGGVTAPETRV